MKNKSIYDSGTTKGSAPRTSDKKKYDKNWEKIFGKRKKNIRKFYSSEDCKVDESGGPHKIDLDKLNKNESKNS